MAAEHISGSGGPKTAGAHANLSGAILFKLARAHFEAAHAFCCHVRDGEAGLGKPLDVAKFEESVHQPAVACLFFCAAAVEAAVNEIIVEHAKSRLRRQTDEERLRGLFYMPVSPERAREVCHILGKGEFNHGAGAAQQAAIALDLRNALVHFKPEWPNEQGKHAKLNLQLKQLAGVGLSEHLDDRVYFPRGWATHKTTKWAVDACLGYVIDLVKHLSLDPAKFEGLRTNFSKP